MRNIGLLIGVVSLGLNLAVLAAEKPANERVQPRASRDQRTRERLQDMSPEERDITRLGDPDISENQVIEIYNRIDGFSEENKKALALVLKAYWESQGKWKKKDCSKKQREKVQKIKSILAVK